MNRAYALRCGAIVKTKILVPSPRAGLVLRPRLYEQLDRCVARPFTLVVAPAGYGKTTLLATWARANDTRGIAWVYLDQEDRDPARFFRCIVAS